MIDTHCHLLPGIDDGPETLEQSLELARIAVENGITHSVLTPHIHPGRFDNTAGIIEQALESFRRALQEHNIPLALGYAAEVRLGPELLEMEQQHNLPCYGNMDGYRILLLEFPHAQIPLGSDKLVQWLLDRKIRPMIAHPERNKDIMRKFDKVLPFIEMGCLFQLTAGSVAGLFGEAAQLSSRALLENGCVTLLASDAHNVKYRPPRLDHGRDAAAQIVGEELAGQMVYERPRALVASQFPDLQAELQTEL